MSATIRPCTLDEAGAVLELWQVAEAEPSHTDDIPSIVGLLNHDPGGLLVADDTGQIVGSVIAGWDGWRGSIYRLVVAPSHRRQGLARRLLAEAEVRLRSQGATRLAAIVVDRDLPAIGFWRSSDWQEQTSRLRFVNG
jgi:ribosomal protein S18 acetylase RimI-like enzyme